MGSDKSHNKHISRKKAAKLERKKARENPNKRVLIICEGEKTEPNYLKGFRNLLKLKNASIKICGDCGSSPKSIFEYAEDEYKKSERENAPYDKVFCVFDKDRHPSYRETLDKIERNAIKSLGTKENIFKAITSVPCFEYFILLHYEYTTKPYASSRKNSPCDCVTEDLKTHMPNYQKASNDIFNLTYEKLTIALSNSKKALKAAENADTDNPTTLMHELIEYLQKLASQKHA